MSPTRSSICPSGQLAMALLLVAAIVVVSVRQSLGLERDLAVGTVRAIVQLYVVGLILAAVFAAARWYWVLLILGVMTGVATQAAVSRLGKPLPGGAWIAAMALTVSTAATLAYVIGVVVQVRPLVRTSVHHSYRGHDPRQLDDERRACGRPSAERSCVRARMKSRRGSLLASPDGRLCSRWYAHRSGRR